MRIYLVSIQHQRGVDQGAQVHAHQLEMVNKCAKWRKSGEDLYFFLIYCVFCRSLTWVTSQMGESK